MTVGVHCESAGKDISFEDCAACGKCLSPKLIKSLRSYDHYHTRNKYHVKDVIGCLRQSYFDRKNSSTDVYQTLTQLFQKKRGDLMGKIAATNGWNELDGSLTYNIDGEEVTLSGKLDLYDSDRHEIIELKSAEKIWSDYYPKTSDIWQVQCYEVIFKKIFPVEKLTLVYLGMNTFRKIDVPIVDRASWLKERVELLHRSIRDSKVPREEESYSCKYCKHHSACEKLKVENEACSGCKGKKQCKLSK